MIGKKFSPFWRQCFVTAAVSTNMISSGCAYGFPGVLLPELLRPGAAISITQQQASWLASVGSILMVVGNFLIPVVMSRAGRKAAHYVVVLLLTAGWLTIILAPSYEVILFGRMLQGLSFGMNMPVRSILIGEYTSPRHRGCFLTTTSLAQTVGILIVHLTGSLTSYQMTALGSISFAFISLLLMVFSPESPSWLATQGKYDKCRKNFLWLRGEEELPELDKMVQTVKQFEGQEPVQSRLQGIIAVARKKEFYKPIFLMYALFAMLAFAGGVIMGAYPVTVLQSLMNDADPHFWMVVFDAERLIFSGAAVYLIHRIRRRTMVFTLGLLCAGTQMLIAAYVFAKTKGYLLFDSVWIPVTLVSLQMLSVSAGMQPLPAVIAGEVFPLQHRGLAGSIGLLANCGSIFVLLKTFPSLISLMGLHGTYALYSMIITACLMVTWFLLPETSGRTLQQIEEHFRGEPLDLEAYPKEDNFRGERLQDLEADSKEAEPLNEVEDHKHS